MDTYDLELAFYTQLISLSYSNQKTLRPDEIFDPKEFAASYSVRRGAIVFNEPETIGFGNGVYTRTEGLYQIDIWLPRDTTSALKTLKQMADSHVATFWPSNGRGIALTQNSTTANIIRRPSQRHLGRDGSYLREIVEVDFYVEVFPS